MQFLANHIRMHITDISRRRDDRIRSTSIDTGKMCEIEQTVQKTLLGIPSSIGIFNTLVVRKNSFDCDGTADVQNNKCEQGLFGAATDALRTRQMVEHIAQLVQTRAASLVWRAALEKPERQRIEVANAEAYLDVLTNRGQQIADLGLTPVLLVRGRSDPLWMQILAL